MRKSTLTLVISALLVSGQALAGGKQEAHGKAEAKAHTHGQAELSIGSVRTMGSATAFSRLDANADGRISESEAQAMRGLPQQWSKLDVDGNGSLSMTEFAALSSNSSGIRGEGNNDTESGISAQVDTGVAGVGIGVDTETEAETRTDSSAKGKMKGKARFSIEDVSPSNAVQAFNQVDVDGDFKLTEEEAARIEGLKQKFAELDSDGDGALDYVEFNAVTRVEHKRK